MHVNSTFYFHTGINQKWETKRYWFLIHMYNIMYVATYMLFSTTIKNYSTKNTTRSCDVKPLKPGAMHYEISCMISLQEQHSTPVSWLRGSHLNITQTMVYISHPLLLPHLQRILMPPWTCYNVEGRWLNVKSISTHMRTRNFPAKRWSSDCTCDGMGSNLASMTISNFSTIIFF